MRTWTATQLRAFLNHMSSDQLFAAYPVLGTTGARRGEVLALRWADVDLERARVSIRRSLVRLGSGVAFSEPNTRMSRRLIALDPTTVAALKDHRKRQLEERLLIGPGFTDQDLVFAELDGSPLSPGNFDKAFRRHVKAAVLPMIRVHDLRHTHGTLVLSAGIHPKVVSERLGHSPVGITLDVYSHVIPAMQEADGLVASIVFGPSGAQKVAN
jgi:integrase